MDDAEFGRLAREFMQAQAKATRRRLSDLDRSVWAPGEEERARKEYAMDQLEANRLWLKMQREMGLVGDPVFPMGRP